MHGATQTQFTLPFQDVQQCTSSHQKTSSAIKSFVKTMFFGCLRCSDNYSSHLLSIFIGQCAQLIVHRKSCFRNSRILMFASAEHVLCQGQETKRRQNSGDMTAKRVCYLAKDFFDGVNDGFNKSFFF